MKTTIQIKSIFGKLLFEFEKEDNTIKQTLIEAIKSGANLSGAYLSRANLYRANLSGAEIDYNSVAFQQTRILPEGQIIGWKKCRNNVIVKLSIPAEAKRSHAFGRKCRAEFADVIEIFGADKAVSNYDNKATYEVGKRIYPDCFDEDWQDECSNGIHFFITRIEAENY